MIGELRYQCVGWGLVETDQQGEPHVGVKPAFTIADSFVLEYSRLTHPRYYLSNAFKLVYIVMSVYSECTYSDVGSAWDDSGGKLWELNTDMTLYDERCSVNYKKLSP